MGEFGPTFVAAPCLHRLSLPLSHTHSFLVTFLSPSYDLIFCMPLALLFSFSGFVIVRRRRIVCIAFFLNESKRHMVEEGEKASILTPPFFFFSWSMKGLYNV